MRSIKAFGRVLALACTLALFAVCPAQAGTYHAYVTDAISTSLNTPVTWHWTVDTIPTGVTYTSVTIRYDYTNNTSNGVSNIELMDFLSGGCVSAFQTVDDSFVAANTTVHLDVAVEATNLPYVVTWLKNNSGKMAAAACWDTKMTATVGSWRGNTITITTIP